MYKCFLLVLLFVLSGCVFKSTEEFGTEKPRVVWDAEDQAWVVKFHMGNVFSVERLKDLDRNAKCPASP